MNRKHTGVAFLLVSVCVLGGCNKEDEVSVATTPKEQSAPAAPQVAMPAAERGLNWVIPSGWKQDPVARPMREATLIIDDGKAEMIVSRLSNTFGDLGANINRWRGQVGAEPLADTGSIKPETVATPVGDAQIYKIEGPEKASQIAMVKSGPSTWFFRLTGDKAAVQQNEAKLKELLSSLTAQ